MPFLPLGRAGGNTGHFTSGKTVYGGSKTNPINTVVTYPGQTSKRTVT